jgi:hypothetical protein
MDAFDEMPLFAVHETLTEYGTENADIPF